LNLLGTPDFQGMELGRVNGPENYSFSLQPRNELRQDGHRDYWRQQWSSSKITIGVISDLEGQVVCRYSYAIQTRSWLEVLRKWIAWMF
jgi:hypothetical protein